MRIIFHVFRGNIILAGAVPKFNVIFDVTCIILCICFDNNFQVYLCDKMYQAIPLDKRNIQINIFLISP